MGVAIGGFRIVELGLGMSHRECFVFLFFSFRVGESFGD